MRVENSPATSPVDKKKVLIVEDDMTIQPALEGMIRKLNPNVSIDWTTKAEEALALLAKVQDSKVDIKSYITPYHVVLSDISLAGGKTGVDLVNACHSKQISANFVLTSGNSSFETSFPFLPKPINFRDVEACMGPYLRAKTAPNPNVWNFWTFIEDAKAFVQLARLDRDRQFGWFIMVVAAILIASFFSQLTHEIEYSHQIMNGKRFYYEEKRS